MSTRLPRLLLMVAAAVLPGVASAWNALKNGDFTGGADSWNLSSTLGGSAGYESIFGTPAGGSLRLQSYDFNDTSHADQCVDVQKWFVIDFSLRKFNNGESGTGTHPFTLEFYDEAACPDGHQLPGTITLPEAGTAEDGNPATGWVEVSVLGSPMPSGAISAKVNLNTIAGSAGVSYYLIDHVQVVPPDEIFPDAFEGG
jgi:hypothetical protein